MAVSKDVEILIVSENTAQIRTSRAAYMLDQARVAKQFDPVANCWMTSRRTLPDLLAWLETRKRRAVITELLS